MEAGERYFIARQQKIHSFAEFDAKNNVQDDSRILGRLSEIELHIMVQYKIEFVANGVNPK